MALTYARMKSEQFSFRMMKEVRSYVRNGGKLAHARDGMVIALAHICQISEEEVVNALRPSCFVDTCAPSSDRRFSDEQGGGEGADENHTEEGTR